MRCKYSTVTLEASSFWNVDRDQVGESLDFYLYRPYQHKPIIIIFNHNLKTKDMWSLNCEYYTKEFPTLEALLENIVMSGMDPNYEVTRDGKGIGEEAIDFIR